MVPQLSQDDKIDKNTLNKNGSLQLPEEEKDHHNCHMKMNFTIFIWKVFLSISEERGYDMHKGNSIREYHEGYHAYNK